MNSEIFPAENNNNYYGVANYDFPNHWNDLAVEVGVAHSVYVFFVIHPHIAAKGVTSTNILSTYWEVTNVLLFVRLDLILPPAVTVDDA